MATPRLHKRGDRSYSLTGPNVGDLYLHRWTSPDRASVIVMFPSHSISVLGPCFILDELVECVAEVVTR